MSEADILSCHANVPHGLAELIVIHADRLGYSLRAIRSDSRKRPLVRARWQIIGIVRAAGFSSPVIGRAMNRDHSSILDALKHAA